MGYTLVWRVLRDTENPWRYLASSYILASEKRAKYKYTNGNRRAWFTHKGARDSEIRFPRLSPHCLCRALGQDKDFRWLWIAAQLSKRLMTLFTQPNNWRKGAIIYEGRAGDPNESSDTKAQCWNQNLYKRSANWEQLLELSKPTSLCQIVFFFQLSWFISKGKNMNHTRFLYQHKYKMLCLSFNLYIWHLNPQVQSLAWMMCFYLKWYDDQPLREDRRVLGNRGILRTYCGISRHWIHSVISVSATSALHSFSIRQHIKKEMWIKN